MTWLNRISPAAREEVRQARRDQARESKAERVARAKLVLQSAEKNARKPRERNPKFLAWVRRAPCIACAIRGDHQADRTEAAHVRRAFPEAGWRPVGGGEKPSDFRCLPLCRTDHRDQHEHDNPDWYYDLGIYPPDVCAELMRAFQAGADPVETIAAIAAQVIQEGDN